MDANRGAPRLRIAIVSTCALPTPPTGYGGTELVVADLARALAALGHDPVVFATGDSSCVGARQALFSRAIWPPDPMSELRHVAAAWQHIARGNFDVVHLNDAGGALPFTSFVGGPTVATVHHDRVEALAQHYAAYPDVSFVAISNRQADLMWEVPFATVIRHGLDPERYPQGNGGGGHCAFVGRLSAVKAPHLAIEAAREAQAPLFIGGGVHPFDREYFARDVAPRLGGGARWVGELDQRRKVELLQGARCLLFPIQWEEPFGLAIIEAMLVGTPVIAFGAGSVPEIVEEGVTGFVVNDVQEMRKRIADVARIDRARCRARALERWSSLRMARQYADLYHVVTSRAGAAAPHERTLLVPGPNGSPLA
jgi:glycosyltransferase involved in cell wall biosynthesis